MSGGHTKGAVLVTKCPCGDRRCDQYRLSTQGTPGFSLEDATLYAASPELLEALQELLKIRSGRTVKAARAAIAKALGTDALLSEREKGEGE